MGGGGCQGEVPLRCKAGGDWRRGMTLQFESCFIHALCTNGRAHQKLAVAVILRQAKHRPHRAREPIVICCVRGFRWQCGIECPCQALTTAFLVSTAASLVPLAFHVATAAPPVPFAFHVATAASLVPLAFHVATAASPVPFAFHVAKSHHWFLLHFM